MLTEDLIGVEAAREAVARERLEELQALARTYRNWSVKELALALGRQPGRLVPESGMPKIDLVVGLAKSLDWPVEAVVDHLMKPGDSGKRITAGRDTAADFATLYNASLQHRSERGYAEAIRLAVRAHVVADNPTRKAAAYYIESLAHEACGSFVEAVRCLRESVRLDGVRLDWRLLADAQLANMLFMQGHATHAIGIATSVLEYSDALDEAPTMKLARALAHWSRGHALRSSVPLVHTGPWKSLAESARADFRAASDLSDELAACPAISSSRNLDFAACIDVSILELNAVCDEGTEEISLQKLLEVVRTPECATQPSGERKAWAAVSLANTAKRFVSDEMQCRGMLEVASAALRAHALATSNWYFGHRHLEIDNERRRTLQGHGSARRALDATEARLVAGVLGQIPGARGSADEFFELYACRQGGTA